MLFLSTLFPFYHIKTALNLNNAITSYFPEVTLKICDLTTNSYNKTGDKNEFF